MATPGSIPPVGPSPIAATHGPILVGIFVACMLTGAIATQVFHYAVNFPKDPRWLKTFVAVLFVLDLMSTACAIWFIYDLLIDNFMNITPFMLSNWKLAADPCFVGVIGMQCQLFYAWRIRRLTNSLWYAGIVAFCSIASGLTAIGSGIAVGIVKDLTKFDKLKAIGVPWLVFTALSDVLITSLITFSLQKHKTGIRRTDHILNNITRMTVQNGFLTATAAVIQMGFYVGKPQSGVYIGLSYVLAKLYGISVLNSLNSRRTAADGAFGDTRNLTTRAGREVPTHASSLHFAAHTKASEPDVDRSHGLLSIDASKPQAHQMVSMPSRAETEGDCESDFSKSATVGKAPSGELA